MLNNLSTNVKVLTIKAINWTPWWGGDYTTNTITIENNSVKRLSLPTIETIKGAVKWVLRAAVSCHFRGSSYKELNMLLAPIYGGTVRDRENEFHFDSLIRLNVKASIINKAKIDQINQEVSQIVQMLDKLWNSVKKDRNKFAEALLCLALSKYRCSKNFLSLEKDCQDVINALKSISAYVNKSSSMIEAYGISRVRLALLGISDPKDAAELLPLPPNTIETDVTLSINQRLINILGINTANDLTYLTGLAIVYAFEVLGLGRGSSRGFGRFKIDSINALSNLAPEDLLSNLKSCAENIVNPTNPALVKKSIEDLHEELCEKSKILIGASQRILSELDINKDFHDFHNISKQSRVPCLNDAIVKTIINLRHPFPAPPKRLGDKRPKQIPSPKPAVSNAYEALSAIGYATLKVLWKAYSLGTVAAKRKSSTTTVSEIPGIGYHTWILGLPRWQQKTKTGYMLSDKNVYSTCSDKLKEFKGRRKSSIIIYPLPEGKSALILVLKTFDDHLKFIESHEKEDKKMYLVHVGKHRRQMQYHVVSVYYAAQKEYLQSTCGNDEPVGIIFPKNVITASNPDAIIEKVYETAVNFLETLLS